MEKDRDIAIIGAGAAGMAAAIFAAEAGCRSIVLIDSARKPGAKILVSGGGRCNVTNREVKPEDYNGGSHRIIRNVLRAFDEHHTIEWMRSLGVELKLEATGKYFPVTDKARTVLDALLTRIQELGIEFSSGNRVTAINREEDCFRVDTVLSSGWCRARRVIVATGGKALPKSGSDGEGLAWLAAMGHTIVPTTPALAPLVLRENPSPGGRFAELSGITVDMRIGIYSETGRKIRETIDSLLFTHFGLSGPGPMNASRHLARFAIEDPGAKYQMRIGHPRFASSHDADQWLQEKTKAYPKAEAATIVAEIFPARYAKMLTEGLGRMSAMTRAQRLELANSLQALPVQVTGDRGYTFAETTAGGVELSEVNPRTMESRKVPGLHLCGEVLDADGRIGGFNFQWAWASGHLAGRGAASVIAQAVQ